MCSFFVQFISPMSLNYNCFKINKILKNILRFKLLDLNNL